MTDILGPASDQAVTVRPDRTNTRGSSDTWFADCSGPTAEDGTELPADWLNDTLAQLRTAFTSSGIARDNEDDMLWRAMRAVGIRYAADSGAADALVMTCDPPIPSYYAGLMLLTKVGNDNTGAAAINVDTKGSKTIVHADGTALIAGDLKTGMLVLLSYDGTNFQIIAPAPVAAASTWDLIVEDQRSSGVDGDNSTTTFGTCTLNTVIRNTLGVTLASNVISNLPAGHYIAEWSIQFINSNYSRSRLVNATSSAELKLSSSNYSEGVTGEQTTHSFGVHDFTLAAGQSLKLESQSDFAANGGHGWASSIGSYEAYTQLKLKKVS